MLRSAYDNNIDDEDDFVSNPFRNNDSDLLSQPPQGIMMNQALNRPDPHSGMTGSFDPTMPLSHQQDPLQNNSGHNNNNNYNGQSQQTYNQNQNFNSTPQEDYGLSGTMDRRGDEIDSTPVGRLHFLLSCFRIDRHKQYFDMDTIDIYKRLKSSITTFHMPDHFRTNVLGEAGTDDFKGPDLYGPCWIAMTLVFVIAVTSNLSDYVHHRQAVRNNPTDVQEFAYDLHHLIRAGSVVFGFVVILPTLLWLVAICMGMPSIPWSLWICCYGYAQAVFVLAAFVAWIPWSFLDWVALGIATVMSGLLVVRNLSTPLLAQDGANHAKAAPLVMAMLASHFIYVLVLKFTFYGGW